MRIRLVIEYDYEGDEATPEGAIKAEKYEWLAGYVSIVDDILSCNGYAEFSVLENDLLKLVQRIDSTT